MIGFKQSGGSGNETEDSGWRVPASVPSHREGHEPGRARDEHRKERKRGASTASTPMASGDAASRVTEERSRLGRVWPTFGWTERGRCRRRRSRRLLGKLASRRVNPSRAPQARDRRERAQRAVGRPKGGRQSLERRAKRAVRGPEGRASGGFQRPRDCESAPIVYRLSRRMPRGLTPWRKPTLNAVTHA